MNRANDETSEALLAAAHQLLAEHGPEALTVRRIATEAGMSTMNVYSRFGGKDGVIDELFADGFRRLIEQLDSVPSTDDIADDLLACAHAYRDFARSNSTYYGIMFRTTVTGFEPSPDATALALSGLAAFVERVRVGRQLGTIIHAEDCEPTEVAAWLWATCHGLVSLELGGIGAALVDWPSTFETGMRLAIHGVHPSVAPIPRAT